jgi:hypothetical protein
LKNYNIIDYEYDDNGHSSDTNSYQSVKKYGINIIDCDSSTASDEDDGDGANEKSIAEVNENDDKKHYEDIKNKNSIQSNIDNYNADVKCNKTKRLNSIENTNIILKRKK